MSAVETDPLAHVKVGDPDPGPDNPDRDPTDPICEHPTPGLTYFGNPHTYRCMRDVGHPGQHIAAAAGYGVVAVAPQDGGTS